MGSDGIVRELQFFGLAMLRGALILALYDLLRITRRLIPHGVWLIAVQDLLYWICTAFLIFALLYRENDGAVRGYALFAVAAGMIVYYYLIGRWIVEPISGILKTVLEFFLRPAGTVARKLVQVGKITGHFYKNKLKNKLREFIIILFS